VSSHPPNRRSVWVFPTRPFKDAHFAVFPSELIEPCILAGCPEYVCNKCGKPREPVVKRKRITRKELPKDDPRYRPNDYDGSYKDINGKADAGYTVTEIVGLTDCGCNTGFSGGIVLDPFIGSGTTGVVAKKLGRNWIGIELNPEYIKLAEKRIIASEG